ncbi:MAG: glycosyltransferase family 39 protein [Isosphaeraceae bacterium]|nr:glycosyltransferase family 39 protein [Isosphaeraceae bacterium]
MSADLSPEQEIPAQPALPVVAPVVLRARRDEEPARERAERQPAPAAGESLTGKRWWLAMSLVLALALAATVPTTGDIGLTWDEPAYRYSQVMSSQWWERLANARDRAELSALFKPDTLLYYWPYARFGRNFHPPLAGQLSLATHGLFGRWMKDIPARRLASVFEYALTITLAFGFLARRYGPWAGGVAAGALLLMPRVYGDGHIAGTDTPGLLLWGATAVAFWKGLYEPKARSWRVLVGILLGLAFVEKMAAVLVLVPLTAWLVLGHLPRTFLRRSGRADWVDGLVTSSLMLAPLAVAFRELLRIASLLPPPNRTDLAGNPFPSAIPGAILAVPLLVWVGRRVLGHICRAHAVWGAERPALELWTSVLAFAPVVGWLGNPAWWRDTLPRLAHYYAINSGRRGALPDIYIYYLGRTYEYSLPWHNAWVLIAVTVPASLLAAAVSGLLYALRRLGRDRLPVYFLVHLVTLPVLRMLDVPAHDGVRLFLPTFFFLAAFAGWGAVWVADGLASATRLRPPRLRAVVAALVLGPAAWGLVKIHPYELSYYNELVGGPRGAWRAGFELTYWYDAFNTVELDALNDAKRGLPHGAVVDFLNERTNPDTFQELQSLGALRSDIVLGLRGPDDFPPYVWLLSQDSKATDFTRLLFAMRPWFASTPAQLDGARVLTVADPVTVSRAWALARLAARPSPPQVPPPAPEWVARHLPRLRRFWGEGLRYAPASRLNAPLFDWARSDPDGLRAAVRGLSRREPDSDRVPVGKLRALLGRFDHNDALDGLLTAWLLRSRPQAFEEALEIVIAHPDEVRTVLTHPGYTQAAPLDRDLPRP